MTIPTSDKTKKVFISGVTDEFRRHRKDIKDLLDAHDITSRIQEDFPLSGRSLLEWLAECIKDCDKVIHLVGKKSGAFPSDEHINRLYSYLCEELGLSESELPPKPSRCDEYSYTQWEYHLGKLFKRKILLPYFFEDLTPPDDSTQRRHYEYVMKKSGDHYRLLKPNRLELFNAIRHDLGLECKVSSNALPASILTRYKGRAAFVERLEDTFGGMDREELFKPVVICGLGGIGKTRVAAEYAHTHKEKYTVTFWVSINKKGKFRRQLASLYGLIRGDHKARNFNKVTDWLENNRGWMLIIDNVDKLVEDDEDKETAKFVKENIESFQNNGQILITSRLNTWNHDLFCTMDLELLDMESAVEYLCEPFPKKSDPVFREEARAVAERLERLPLALYQAVGYVNEDDNCCSYKKYLEDFETNFIEVLEWHDKSMDNNSVTATTWAMSFKQLSPDAQHLLECLSFLSIEPIPRASLVTPPIFQNVKDLLKELKRHSLIDLDKNFVSVHPLVQEVTRFRIPETEQTERLMTVLRWIDAMDGQFTADIVPHIARASEFGIEERIKNGKDIITEPTLRIRYFLERYLVWGNDTLGVYERCKEMIKLRYERLSGIDRFHLACFYELTSRTALRVAEDYSKLAKDEANHEKAEEYKKKDEACKKNAEAYYKEAEKILHELLESEEDNADYRFLLHRVVSGQVNKEMLCDAPELAEEKYRKSLKIMEGLMEEKNTTGELKQKYIAHDSRRLDVVLQSNLAWSYNNMGIVLKKCVTDAEKYYMKAFKIRQEWASKDARNEQWQRDLRVTYDCIGDLREENGNFEEAKKCYNEALAISRCLTEMDKSNEQYQGYLATSLVKAAELLKKLGELEEAKELFKELLAVHRRLAEHDENNIGIQIDIVLSLQRIDDTDSLKEGHDILEKLKKDNKLPCDRESLIQDFEDRLTELESD